MPDVVRIVPFPPDSSEVLIVRLKTAFITALRLAFNDLHPNTKMQNINLNMEYPLQEEQYPSVWVRFSFRSLNKLGIDSNQFDEEGRVFQQWEFSGKITLVVMALSSQDRDEIASEIIQTYAFSRISRQGRRFREAITDEPYLHIQYDEDKIEPNGQEETVGVPWNSKQVVYMDSYSFNVIGQFRSDIDRAVEPEFLKEIRVVESKYIDALSLSEDIPPDNNDGGWT